MDVLERVFHVSPDGGSGALEALYLVAAVAVLAAIAFRRQIARSLRRGVAARRGR